LRHSRKIFKNQISRKSVSGSRSRVVHADGRTDRHDEANSPFWHYCKRPWKRAS